MTLIDRIQSLHDIAKGGGKLALEADDQVASFLVNNIPTILARLRAAELMAKGIKSDNEDSWSWKVRQEGLTLYLQAKGDKP